MIYFSSDYHFSHKMIIPLADRPFNSYEEMNEGIIKIHNNIVSPHDTFYHLGDFMFYASKRNKVSKFLERLNGNIILLKGNHDKRKVSAKLKEYISINGITICLTHFPGEYDISCDITLCGHVHEKWILEWHDNHPIVNVGWDIWHRPISLDVILDFLNNHERIPNEAKITYFRKIQKKSA